MMLSRDTGTMVARVFTHKECWLWRAEVREVIENSSDSRWISGTFLSND